MSGESLRAVGVAARPMGSHLPHQWFSHLCGGLEAHELLGGSVRARTTPSEGCAVLANQPSLRPAVMNWTKGQGLRLRRNGKAARRRRDGRTGCYA